MESTLSLARSDLQGLVGKYLGYGRGASFGDTTWTTEQTYSINDCIKSGLRQFYTAANGYTWSFLTPVVSLTILTGTSTVPLPDDYGGMQGRITVSTPGSGDFVAVDQVGIGAIYEATANDPTSTGRPIMACEEPAGKPSTQGGQRFQLRFYPSADVDYTLQVQIHVSPSDLTDALPYPYGGVAHAETIRASCLMAAEESLNDERGIWAEKFKERMAASIEADRRNKPQLLGYNGDHSDDRFYRGTRRWNNPVTFNGVSYP